MISGNLSIMFGLSGQIWPLPQLAPVLLVLVIPHVWIEGGDVDVAAAVVCFMRDY